jgi:molybdate transport system ATP-binding protein
MAIIELRNITKVYTRGNYKLYALRDINLKVSEGEFLAIMGPSGSGKTTFLRILAGLEEAEGFIKVGDEIWLDGKKSTPPQKRKIGFVFQDYALFPNMSVEENLLFVNNDKALADYLLEITELDKLKKRLPNSLSGGQKQRVSLCRALMNRPKILLMDEPLSALDPAMRLKLQNEILALHKEFKTTTIMVSHDPSEMYRLSNRMIVLDNGKVIKDDKPKEILLRGKSIQKFSFEGELLDILKADILNIAIVAIGQQLIEVAINSDEAKKFQIGQKVLVNISGFTPYISQK